MAHSPNSSTIARKLMQMSIFPVPFRNRTSSHQNLMTGVQSRIFNIETFSASQSNMCSVLPIILGRIHNGINPGNRIHL